MREDRGLLEEIEDDLLAGKPLADLLRKTILFGGRTDSTELRDWAARELKGFIGTSQEHMPRHRLIQAPLLMDSINARAQATHQPLPIRLLPEFAREITQEFPVRQGIGELEAWAQRGGEIRISVPGGDVIGAELARRSDDRTLQIYAVYWSIDPLTIAGLLDQVRTSLTELIGELRTVTLSGNSPSSEQVSQALTFVINGANHRLSVTTSQTSEGGSTTITSGNAEEQGWWNRSRRIGATLAGAASIVSAVVAVIVL
ncbi:hypothetical protein [Arthrobacter sp. SX1312]|uniref:AbiTii domain-containing protein n=1 Tax=Arthrobacter sp. SX1312 TaxID=2058896 RepID=UPI0011B053A2|nr:hypothetical protein [Arthrobacter sp. SX1312]